MNRTFAFLAVITAVFVRESYAASKDVPEDIADMKVQDFRAGGDERKRYFVIQGSTETPKDGWRSLFVLPGGSGDAEFQPFITRIAKNALPDGYVVVQLVAPVWTPQQAQNNVWPSAKSGVREMKFSTADFFLAVRSELAKTLKLNPRYSFTLTWSSSGMRGYEFSLSSKFGITGTFVAMSIFSPSRARPAQRSQRSPVFHLPFAPGFYSHCAGRSCTRRPPKGRSHRELSDLRGRPRLARECLWRHPQGYQLARTTSRKASQVMRLKLSKLTSFAWIASALRYADGHRIEERAAVDSCCG